MIKVNRYIVHNKENMGCTLSSKCFELTCSAVMFQNNILVKLGKGIIHMVKVLYSPKCQGLIVIPESHVPEYTRLLVAYYEAEIKVRFMNLCETCAGEPFN